MSRSVPLITTRKGLSGPPSKSSILSKCGPGPNEGRFYFYHVDVNTGEAVFDGWADDDFIDVELQKKVFPRGNIVESLSYVKK